MNLLLAVTLLLGVVTVVSAGQACASDEDCGKNQCCAANNIASLLRKKGACKPKAKKGQACNPDDAKLDKFGNMYLKKCPCAADLSCGSAPKTAPSFMEAPLFNRCQEKTEDVTKTGGGGGGGDEDTTPTPEE